METKQCIECKDVKSCIDFYKDSSRKDKLSNRCKICIKNDYLNNKDYFLNNSKRNRENNLESKKEYDKE